MLLDDKKILRVREKENKFWLLYFLDNLCDKVTTEQTFLEFFVTAWYFLSLIFLYSD